MHKILFLNDLSDQAPVAFRYALELAQRLESSVSQVCCNPNMELPLHRGPDRADTLVRALEQFAQEHRQSAQMSAFTLEHLPNWVEDISDVNDLAEVQRAGLLITPELEPRTANLAQQLARRSPLPLLLIPPKATYRPFQKLVFATSFHFNDLIALNLLRRWRSVFQANLDIIHVLESESARHVAAEKMSALSEAYRAEPGISFQIIRGDAPRIAILDYLNEQQADLLTLTTHQRSAWEAFIESSTSRFMIRECPTPLLLIKDLEDAVIS